MKLNIYNNFRAFYYNTLVNFYLYFNTLVPYYDDVILSLSITSFKNIINNNSISLKTINQNRMMKLLYSLNDNDKIIIDDDGFIIIDYADKVITYTEEGNEIIQDNATDTIDTEEQENDMDTNDTENNINNEMADPVVYTQDIIIENTLDIANNPVEDAHDIVMPKDPVSPPFVYTQDIVIDDTRDTRDTRDTIDILAVDTSDTCNTKCYNSLDKKNN